MESTDECRSPKWVSEILLAKEKDSKIGVDNSTGNGD